MPFVTIDNTNIEVDLYGYVLGAKYTTEIQTPLGLMQLEISRMVYCRELVVVADLYQSEAYKDASFTSFSAGAYLRWHNNMYRIFQPKNYTNDLWRALEKIISNVIVVNE